MTFYWTDDGNKNYFSRAKDAVLDWAAEHSNGLQRWGERTIYAAVGTGLASLGAAAALGERDPGTISKYMVTPAAVIFAAGEGMKVLGEYAKDRQNGETDPVKNSGYIARILAPLYAIPFGANGVWEPGHDVATPVGAWVAGTGLTYLGNQRIIKEKTAEAERAVKWFDEKFGHDGIKYLMDQVKRFNPRADVDAVARHMPLNELRNLPEYLNDLLRDENDPKIH